MSIILPRQWRAGTTLLVAAMLIVGLVGPALQGLWERYSQIVDAQARLDDVLNRRRLLALPTTPSSLLADSSEPFLLGASTESEALALFENYLRGSVQAHGGTDIAVRVEAVAEQNIPALRANVSARLPDREALKAIHRLETGSPAVMIDSIRLQSFASASSNASGEWIRLTGSMRVYLALSPKAEKQP